MATSGYWDRIRNQRVRRRQVLAGGVALGTGAIALACGGGNDSGDQGGLKDSSGLVAKVEDTTKSVKRGGTYQAYAAGDTPTFDPIGRTVAASPGAFPTDAYQSLVGRKTGYLKQTPAGEPEPYAAESWELAPDGLSYTMKLRPNGKFDPRPPTNGRVLDAEDVLWSWKRYEQIARSRATLAHSASQFAPLESITAVDKGTISLKLAFPDADFLALVPGLPVMPREAEDKFDPKGDMRGSGPWMLTTYRPSAGGTFEKNPGFYNLDKFYIDKIDVPIVTEYAAGLAQFRAGNVYNFAVKRNEVIQTKKDVTQLNMFLDDAISTSVFLMPLGWSEGSPFRDQRIRQALRLAIDEDAFVSSFFDVDKIKAEGLPVDLYYNSSTFTAGHTGWWLDPRDKNFGPNAKYLKYDPAEAKKLISAAGFPSGLDTPALYFTSGEYGLDFPKYIEAVLGMFNDVGIRPKRQVMDFTTEWNPKVFNAKGKFVGMSFSARAPDTATLELINLYTRAGSRYYGFDVNGQDPANGDPALEDMILKQKQERDLAKRTSMVFDIQRYLADKAYYPQFVPAYPTSFVLYWPIVRNVRVWFNGPGRNYGQWLDPTQPPAKSG